MRRHPVTFAFIAAAIAAHAAPADAGGIVLESYTGGRPADADKYTAPMVDILTKAGFAAGGTVSQQFERDVSRPAVIGTGLPLDFDKQVEAAEQLFAVGNAHDAIAKLSALVELAHANPGAFADQDQHQRHLRRALIVLALAQNTDGDRSAALTTFDEVVRAFPDERVPAGTYGAAGSKLFDEAKTRARRGRLAVTSTAPGGIYLDERLDGVQSVARDNLAAGDYRVFVHLGAAKQSRAHVATVKPGEERTLQIDPDFDTAVRTGAWTGLAFANQAARNAGEAKFAAMFGNAMGADQVVVIGIDTVQNTPSVIASLISKTGGDRIRTAYVPLAAATTAQVQALARFAIGEGPASGDVKAFDPATIKRLDDGAKEPSVVYVHDPGRSHAWKWGFAVGAVAAGIASAPLIYYGPKCTDKSCTHFYGTDTAGYIVLGVGVVSAVVSAVLFLTEHDDPAAPTKGAYVVPAPRGDGALAGYTFRF